MRVTDFLDDYGKIKKQKIESPDCDDFIFGNLFPLLGDKYDNSGGAKGDYFHHDLLAARRIYENKPEKHIDVGSRIDGFVAHVASFREITVLDIRPPAAKVNNISFVQQDFMSELDVSLIESCDSASSLNAMEHFGLGRYGDPVNYDGHLVGLNNLYKLLKKNGKLYFAVPVGCPQRIEFNAHRVFSPEYLIKKFEGKYRIDVLSYVDKAGDLHENADINDFISVFKENYSDKYGSGIFELTKL
jgi:SAM-dependent methyltransferase